MLHVVCWREPLCPLPCIELTIFCSVFRLHPPSFLFVLALDSHPWGSEPLPHRFSFQLSTTMALAPASPLPAWKGCNPPAGKHVQLEPPSIMLPSSSLRVCAGTAPLGRQNWLFPPFSPQTIPSLQGRRHCGMVPAHTHTPCALALPHASLQLAASPDRPADPFHQRSSTPLNPEFSHGATISAALPSPAPLLKPPHRSPSSAS